MSEPLPDAPPRPYVREQHGMRHTKIYGIYTAILRRCRNPNALDYERYGGRGITVCEKWQKSFLAFYADVGDQPPGMQIDRIDNSGNYEPGNVRWVSVKDNCRNRRSSTYVEFRGERMTLAELSERTGMGVPTILWRMKKGMTAEQAVTEPKAGVFLEFRGERVQLTELARRFGINHDVIRRRMEKGQTLEDAIAGAVECRRGPRK
jgi:hypothetical protein